MSQTVRTRIEGEFTGYDDGAIFKLANGEVWQQKRYRYRYKYAYRPEVRIYRQGGDYMMEVSCMDEPISVVRANLVVEGAIVSDFTGFNQGMKFEFQNGQIWEQAEYKYSYHYAYRPQAVVVDGINGCELHVDGLSDTVRVRRLR
jgi:hypothetical protein